MLIDDIKNPNKVVIFSTAPAIRVSLGDEFGFPKGEFVEGKMIALLRKLGADFVFDVTFGADMTIMEEANELLTRIQQNKNLPQFSSCCPAWVRLAETVYPEIIQNISTAKSPIAMQGVTIKTYFAKTKNINPENIVSVIITPCSSKKVEITRPEFNSAGKYFNKPNIRDNDYVLTTQELVDWAKQENINFNLLENSKFDNLLGKGSGAGMIFGKSGGVAEAVIRTVYYLVNNKEISNNSIKFENSPTIKNVKETSVVINNKLTLNIACICGVVALKNFIQQLKTSNKQYHFIEVMSCDGGCVGGGNLPKNENNKKQIIESRTNSLLAEDLKNNVKFCYNNPEIKKAYENFFEKPLSDKSKKLLHTTYTNRSVNISKK